MRLVADPVRYHFLKPIIAAEPYVEDLVSLIPRAASEGFQTLAGFRLAAQQKTFGWGVSYTKWVGRVTTKYSGDSENEPMLALLTAGMPVSFMPFGFVSFASYLTPWTAAAAAPMDAWNIYKHFS